MSNFTPFLPLNVSSHTYPLRRCLYNNVHQKEMKKIIAIIYILTSVLSILGAGSVIIYSIVKRIVRRPEVHPLFHLALADLLLASLWFSGACLWFHKQEGSCFKLDVFAEMAHLATFFLTVNYGLNAFLRLQEKVKNLQVTSASSSKFYIHLSRMSYAMCWTFPVAIMVPLLFHYDEVHIPDECTRCLLLFDRPKVKSSLLKSNSMWQTYGSVALVTTLTFSIVALMENLNMSGTKKDVTKRTSETISNSAECYAGLVDYDLFSGVLTDRQRASIDAIRNKVFLYVLVFLICWSPALVVAVCDIDPRVTLSNMRRWHVLFVLLGLTAPMQGFLNCIVYGWSRKSFRDASGQRRSWLLDSDEYESSHHRRESQGSMRSL